MGNRQFFHEQRVQSLIKAEIVAKYFAAWANIMASRAVKYGGKIGLIREKSEAACLRARRGSAKGQTGVARRDSKAKLGVLRRDGGRADVRGQNWHGRTSVAFAV